MDSDRVIRYWNRGAERITGYRAEEVVGTACRDNVLMHVDAEGHVLCESSLCPALKTISDGLSREAEVFLHHKEGHRLPVLTRISAIMDSTGRITGAAEIFTDNRQIWEMRERIEKLEKETLLDPLTQIGNRRYAELQIESSLSALDRYDWTFGIFFLDIDGFKKLNDTYGHDVGDRVLRAVANTLSHSLRASDITCRWGSDEFIAVVPHVEKPLMVKLGKKMLALIHNSVVLTDSATVQVSASIGGGIARSGDTVDSLVKRADQLMYRSKESGGNRLTLDS
jgi:diguanylate cyclase (GGDEF)-like protein/PAS domain S-box-containing protein